MKQKQLIVTLALISSLLVANGQSGILNYYAWKQAGATVGIKQTEVSENNEVVTRSPRSVPAYRIFLDMNKRAPVKVDLIWVGGKAYRAVENKQVSNAIIYKTSGLGTSVKIDTLAPRTSMMRKEIGVGAAVKQSVIFPQGFNEQDFVISYWWKGKRYFYTLRNFKDLPEQVLE